MNIWFCCRSLSANNVPRGVLNPRIFPPNYTRIKITYCTGILRSPSQFIINWITAWMMVLRWVWGGLCWVRRWRRRAVSSFRRGGRGSGRLYLLTPGTETCSLGSRSMDVTDTGTAFAVIRPDIQCGRIPDIRLFLFPWQFFLRILWFYSSYLFKQRWTTAHLRFPVEERCWPLNSAPLITG